MTTIIDEKYNDNEYKKKSITLNDEHGKQLVEPESLNFLGVEDLEPIYKVFTNIQGTNLGSNVVLECSDFQSLWREEMFQLDSTKNQNMNKIHIKMHELVAAPLISRRLVNLTSLNIRTYVENNVSKSFMRQIDQSIFYGDGVKQPLGLLSYYEKNKKETDKPKMITLKQEDLIGQLLNMEHSLNHIYKKNAFWIMSRNLHNLLQKTFYTSPNEYSSIINRDDINYRLFNRKLYVCDELDNALVNTNKINCMLVNPVAYTTIEDKQLKIIENNVDIDLKIIFIKYFGGTITDSNAIVYGVL